MKVMSSVVSVPCAICGANDFQVQFAAGVAQVNQVVKCNRCGLMYAEPRRFADCEEMEARQEEWDFVEHNRQRFEKEQLQVRDYAGARELLGRLHPRRGRLLEIGSSCGFQLDAFRAQGWDVFGVEPDKNAARYAVDKLGIPTVVSTIERAGIQDESVDVVIMLHVIEHVPDPVGTLREIFRVLKPGGHLLLETPRYDTLMYRIAGRRERSLSCDGHIYFFTTESLRKAYARAGFELEKSEYVGRSLTLDRLAYNVGVMAKSVAVQRRIAALSQRFALSRFKVSINVRDMQRVTLQKPSLSALSQSYGPSLHVTAPTNPAERVASAGHR